MTVVSENVYDKVEQKLKHDEPIKDMIGIRVDSIKVKSDNGHSAMLSLCFALIVNILTNQSLKQINMDEASKHVETVCLMSRKEK